MFPDACKVAKLESTSKKGKKTDRSNYRPISLNPLKPSKILEKVVNNKANDCFLSENKYATTNQTLAQVINKPLFVLCNR